MYKLIALDLDGTLLNENHEISEKNSVMIKKAREKGLKVILLSGREPNSIRYFSDELGLEELMGGFNGGIITENKLKNFYLNRCLDEHLAKEIINLMEEWDLCGVVFTENSMYIKDKKDERISTFESYTIGIIEEVGKLSTFLDEKNLWNTINKVLLIDDNNRLNKYKEQLFYNYDRELTAQFSLPYFLEIYSKDISKGRALEYISNFYGIERNQIIAIGDGENDIDMIRYAGLGVAMGNAPELVKMSADIVTLSNKEDGVSHIIKEYIVK